MNNVIVECKGGVVQQVTVVGSQIRVFVIDWDEQAEAAAGGSCGPKAAACGVKSLALEARALYERTAFTK